MDTEDLLLVIFADFDDGHLAISRAAPMLADRFRASHQREAEVASRASWVISKYLQFGLLRACRRQWPGLDDFSSAVTSALRHVCAASIRRQIVGSGVIGRVRAKEKGSFSV